MDLKKDRSQSQLTARQVKMGYSQVQDEFGNYHIINKKGNLVGSSRGYSAKSKAWRQKRSLAPPPDALSEVDPSVTTKIVDKPVTKTKVSGRKPIKDARIDVTGEVIPTEGPGGPDKQIKVSKTVKPKIKVKPKVKVSKNGGGGGKLKLEDIMPSTRGGGGGGKLSLKDLKDKLSSGGGGSSVIEKLKEIVTK